MIVRARLSNEYLFLALALAAGEWLATSFCELSALWPAAVFAALTAALFGYGFAFRIWRQLTMFFVGIALAFAADADRIGFLRSAEIASGPLEAELEVLGRISVRGEWVSFDSETCAVPLRVIMPRREGEALPRIGEIRHTAGWLERRKIGDRRRRILWVKGRVTRCDKVGEIAFAPVLRFLDRVRARLSENLAFGVGDLHSVSLLRAMVLGERSELAAEDRIAFRDAGTMHVFAISGLHIGVIAIMLVVFLVLCSVPLRWAGIAMIPMLWAYVLMIGFPPSAIRAALMASLYFAAPAFWRRSDSLVAWSQTFLLVHVLSPLQITDVGSLLSFMVMFWLLFYGRWAKAIALRPTVAAMGFPVIAWSAGTPIAARVFERITPGGLLANFAVVPLASLAVICGVLGASITMLCPFLGAHFNNAAALIVNAMCLLSRAVASCAVSNFATEPWSVPMCIGWYVAMLLVFYLIYSIVRRHRSIFD